MVEKSCLEIPSRKLQKLVCVWNLLQTGPQVGLIINAN